LKAIKFDLFERELVFCFDYIFENEAVLWGKRWFVGR
jgi:hypothetical protein